MTSKKNGPQAIGDLLGGLIPREVKRTADAVASKGKGKGEASRALTRSDSALIDAAADIATSLPTGEDMAFTHAVLCQVGLPRAKVEGREFMRQSGAAWVNVQAGYLDEGNGPVLQPIPYGVMPRLALAWVSTFAVRNKEREIKIGDSAAEFLSLMGLMTKGRAMRPCASRCTRWRPAVSNSALRAALSTGSRLSSSTHGWRTATPNSGRYGRARWCCPKAISHH